MIHLDLTSQETDTLRAAVEGALSDLSYEIANTDSLDYREALKFKRSVLRKTFAALTETRQLA